MQDWRRENYGGSIARITRENTVCDAVNSRTRIRAAAVPNRWF